MATKKKTADTKIAAGGQFVEPICPEHDERVAAEVDAPLVESVSVDDIFEEIGEDDIDTFSDEENPDDEGIIVPEFDENAHPFGDMNEAQAAAMAKKIVENIDNHPEGLPPLPLNVNDLHVWAIECTMVGTGEPALIITFASSAFPRGIPFVLTRDRALKFASQVKRFANTGPSLQQRAAQSGLSVPPDASDTPKLIVPGR